MKNKIGLLLFSAALACVLGVQDAWSQVSRGNIRGEVLDTEGNPLPGVSVTATSPAMIQPRTVVTGPNGDFNMPSIPIGTYAVTASLTGFAPSKAENVKVNLGSTAQVNIKMRLEATVGETMEVTTDVPIIDATDTSTGGRIDAEELVKVPTARDPWSVLALVPGIQSDRVNVGGSESGQQANFVAKGSQGSQTSWSIDGVTITDAGAIGSSPTYYDFGAIEEVQVNTGGADVSQLSGGVGINVVTKRGSNDIHGSVRAFFSNDALQGSNVSDELAEAFPLDEANEATFDTAFLQIKNDQLFETGGEVGGPVVKDKLWFWGSLNRNKIEQLSNRVDKTKYELTGEVAQLEDNTELINYAAKLSGQVMENNEANAFFHFGDKKKEGRTALPLQDGASSWNQGGGTPVYKIEDQQLIGSDGLVAAKFAYVGGGFHLYPQGSAIGGNSDPKQARYDLATGFLTNNFYAYETDRPQTMFNADGSYFKALGSTDNDFKFGFSFRSTPVESHTFYDDGVLIYDQSSSSPGAPDIAAFFGNHTIAYEGKTISLYASDTISTGNLTLDVGFRYDRQTAKNRESIREENPIFGQYMGELTYDPDAAGEEEITYNLVSPRVGFGYQLGEKTLIKANYALYADQIGPSTATTINPIGTQYLYSYFYDGVGGPADGQVQFGEIVQIPGYPCGGYCLYGVGIDPDNPNSLETLNQIDADLVSPKTNEVVFGLTQQVGKDSSVGFNFTFRNRSDALVNIPLVRDSSGNVRPVTFDDWEALPSVPTSADADGNYAGDFVVDATTVTPYALKSGISPVGGTLLTNRDGYTERFMGLELLFQKRFSNNWSFAGNLALNDWTQNFTEGGEGDFPNPNRTIANTHDDGGQVAPGAGSSSGPRGQVFFNAKWQGNVRGTYTIPGVGIDLGATMLLRQGYPTPFFQNVRSRTGRNFTATSSGSTIGLLTGEEVDSVRMGTLANLDIRIGKEFKFGPDGRYGVEASADIFNLLNGDTLLQHLRQSGTTTISSTGTTAAASSTFLRPTEILGPRTVRFSARIKF